MSGCRKDKQRNVDIVKGKKLGKQVASKRFEHATPIGHPRDPESLYEIRKKKKKVTMNNPVVISAETLQRAKLSPTDN